jgi:hypothetical protein
MSRDEATSKRSENITAIRCSKFRDAEATAKKITLVIVLFINVRFSCTYKQ